MNERQQIALNDFLRDTVIRTVQQVTHSSSNFLVCLVTMKPAMEWDQSAIQEATWWVGYDDGAEHSSNATPWQGAFFSDHEDNAQQTFQIFQTKPGEESRIDVDHRLAAKPEFPMHDSTHCSQARYCGSHESLTTSSGESSCLQTVHIKSKPTTSQAPTPL